MLNFFVVLSLPSDSHSIIELNKIIKFHLTQTKKIKHWTAMRYTELSLFGFAGILLILCVFFFFFFICIFGVCCGAFIDAKNSQTGKCKPQTIQHAHYLCLSHQPFIYCFQSMDVYYCYYSFMRHIHHLKYILEFLCLLDETVPVAYLLPDHWLNAFFSYHSLK